MSARLKKIYEEKIVPELMEKMGYKNRHDVPKIEKIVINMRVGDGNKEKSFLEAAVSELGKITGQKPVVTRAKKAVSNFGIKKGDSIGCRVTLRRKIMYEFLDRFINIALPRIRDFNGVKNNSFDGRGNYNLGIKEQAVFPELDYGEIKRTQGMDIVFTIKSAGDEDSSQLLKMFGMPFKKSKNI